MFSLLCNTSFCSWIMIVIHYLKSLWKNKKIKNFSIEFIDSFTLTHKFLYEKKKHRGNTKSSISNERKKEEKKIDTQIRSFDCTEFFFSIQLFSRFKLFAFVSLLFPHKFTYLDRIPFYILIRNCIRIYTPLNQQKY